MTGFPEHPFWTFSIAVYGRRGVAPACLALQERRGVDVNVLLLCLWLGAREGRLLDRPDLAAVREAVAAWHEEVVRPLRAVRRRLKTDALGAPAPLAEEVRRRIAAVEIDAEHVEQLMLAAAVERGADGGREDGGRAVDGRTDDGQAVDGRAADPMSAAAANLLGYLEALGVAPSTEDLADLAAVLAGAFPDRPREEARRVLGEAAARRTDRQGGGFS